MVSLSSVVSYSAAVGFSGSRSLSDAQYAEVVSAVGCLSSASVVSVGCARGVDELVRRLVPSAVVFRVADVGFSGRGRLQRGRLPVCVRFGALAVSGLPSLLWFPLALLAWLRLPRLLLPFLAGVPALGRRWLMRSGWGFAPWCSGLLRSRCLRVGCSFL